MRRFGRGTRRSASTATIARRVSALFVSGAGGDWRFEAASYTADVGDPTKVASFYNMVNPTATVAATGAQMSALPTANANFAGGLSASFSGSNRYDSSEAAAQWNVRHNGTGCTEVVVFRPTSALAFGVLTATLRNQDVNTSHGALVGYRTSGTNGLVYRCGNGTATKPFDRDDAAAGVANGTATYLIATYGSSASPNWSLRLKSTLVSSGAQGAAPSASNASATCRLGANAVTGDFGFVGDWVAWYVFRRVLSAADRSVLQTYFYQRWGIAP